MSAITSSDSRLELRSPDTVMRLERLGSAFPTRLSFGRSMIRHLMADNVEVRRTRWTMDANGFGRATYTLELGGFTYSLIAFSNALDEANRSDRVIAEAWDASFALFDGVPEEADLDRLEANLPRQEAGRYSEKELVISRSNKSVRLFKHVAHALAEGQQPDVDMVDSIGYLMRTTAVYGNGKFGIADRFVFSDRPGLSGPFAAEMLTVWLIRNFTHDLVEHVAAALGGDKAVRLDPAIKRHMGIGNSTGLGMAPFLIYHPELIHNWLNARETAIAQVRSIPSLTSAQIARLQTLLERAKTHVSQWHVPDAIQTERLDVLRAELAAMDEPDLHADYPLQQLIDWSLSQSVECQELVAALCLEPFDSLLDSLTDTMAFNAPKTFDAAQTVAQIRAQVAAHYRWCEGFDLGKQESQQRFWYVSEAKLEPRLGDRYEEDGADKEQPLDIARQVQALMGSLQGFDDATTLTDVLARHPEHRNIAKRIQAAAQRPFAEVRDNLIDQSMRPIDLLRCKLAFFGAVKFDPKSDLWTRITLFQGAPLVSELQTFGDDWWLATKPVVATA